MQIIRKKAKRVACHSATLFAAEHQRQERGFPTGNERLTISGNEVANKKWLKTQE
jgi:hypothetical protein